MSKTATDKLLSTLEYFAVYRSGSSILQKPREVRIKLTATDGYTLDELRAIVTALEETK